MCTFLKFCRKKTKQILAKITLRASATELASNPNCIPFLLSAPSKNVKFTPCTLFPSLSPSSARTSLQHKCQIWQPKNIDDKGQLSKNRRGGLQVSQLLHFLLHLISSIFQLSLMKLDANWVNDVSVLCFDLPSRLSLRPPQIATYSRENQTQFEISRAICCHFRQSKARRSLKNVKLIKTNTYVGNVFKTISMSNVSRILKPLASNWVCIFLLLWLLMWIHTLDPWP